MSEGTKVVNIGIIIRNGAGDTFPVALNPQMVSVIQNLLMQIPVMDSKLVDPSGKKLASKQSIPIIPREIEFDWDAAYAPMDRDDELELMKKLNEKYAAMEADPDIVDIDGKVMKLNPETGKPAIGQDPQNPFNLTLDSEGTANDGMTDAEVELAMKKKDQELVDDAKYPDPLANVEKEAAQQDVTVKPEALNLGAELKQIGQD